MRKKIERLIVAASIGAIAACVMFACFNPEIMFPKEDTSWRGDGWCDVDGCNNPRNCFFTKTDDPSSPVTEEFCEFHERQLVMVL